MLVFVKQYNLGMCWSWVHSTHSVSLLWNSSYCYRQQTLKAFGGGLKSCKLGSTSWCKQIYSIVFLHLQLTSWHGFPQSQSIVHGYLLSTYSCGIRILSATGMESGWCRLHCQPFSGAHWLLELWYGVLEALLYLLLTSVIWSSHADLSGSGLHKLIAVFMNTLSSPLAAVSHTTLIICLCLASRASLSSPFSSP